MGATWTDRERERESEGWTGYQRTAEPRVIGCQETKEEWISLGERIGKGQEGRGRGRGGEDTEFQQDKTKADETREGK